MLKNKLVMLCGIANAERPRFSLVARETDFNAMVGDINIFYI